MEASLHHRVNNIEKIHGEIKGLFYIENRTWRFKAFYFLFFFGCGTLRNYLPVYFKHIGISALMAGVLTGVRPFTGFVSAPFFSFLADKTGSHKIILRVALLVSVVSYFSLSFVAIVRQIESSRARHCPANETNTNLGHFQLESKYLNLSNTHRLNSSSNLKINQFYNPIKTLQERPKGNASFEKKYPRMMQSADQDFGGKFKSSDTAFRNEGNSTTDRNATVSCNVVIFSETTIFLGCFGMLILGDFFNAPVGALMCSTVIYWEGSSQFGKQRVFGAVGFGLGSFLTGIAIDKTLHFNYFDPDSPIKTTPNYLTAFFMYLCANGFLFLLISCGLDVVREEKPKLIMWSRVKEILSDVMVVCFLLYIFIMGAVGGVIILFLFWYLESLGASQSLLGISSAVMSISEIPVFILCSKMIKLFGHVGVLCLSLTVSVFRVTLYSILANPWYVLLIEPLHGISLAAMWSVSISFASVISTPELYTTMEGVITGFHFGLGWGLGAVFGGLFYSYYGPRNLFRGCIVLCCIAYILLALVYKLKQRKNSIIEKCNYNFTRVKYNVNVNVGDYDIIPGDVS